MDDSIKAKGEANKLDHGEQSAGASGLAQRVEQLASELARTREELVQYRDQWSQFVALARDLAELKAERASLIQQLKEQAGQIEALTHEVAATREVLAGRPTDGAQAAAAPAAAAAQPAQAAAAPAAATAQPAADFPLEPSTEAEPYTGDDGLPTAVVAQPLAMIEQTVPAAEQPAPANPVPFDSADGGPTALDDAMALHPEQEMTEGPAGDDAEDDDDLEPYGFEEDVITREADESMRELVVTTKDVLEHFEQGSTTGLPAIVAPRTLQIPRPELPLPEDPPPRRSPLPWIALGVAALLAVGVTVFLLTRPGDEERPDTKRAGASSAPDKGPSAVAASPKTSNAPAARPPATGTSRAPTKTAPGTGAAAPDAAPPPPPRRLSRRQRRRRRILLIRATRLLERRRLSGARKLLSRALKLRDDWRVRRLLALSHERSGEPLVAADHLAKGAYHAPAKQKSRLHDLRGQILLKLGRKEAGCAAFEAAVEARPRSIDARKRLTLLCK